MGMTIASWVQVWTPKSCNKNHNIISAPPLGFTCFDHILGTPQDSAIIVPFLAIDPKITLGSSKIMLGYLH